MRMTMVYARIADRTVADEYFQVSAKVEALYDAPKALPADAEGSEMARLRREMHRRMLGNGYCARPVGLDCHFESICESCTFFVTTIEFRPTLERQRDDAAAKGQAGPSRRVRSASIPDWPRLPSSGKTAAARSSSIRLEPEEPRSWRRTARASGPGLRCRSRWPGTSWSEFRRPTSPCTPRRR
jgi:hypothetical protein